MTSLLEALFGILRILRSSVKGHWHIKCFRFPRSCWAALLAYLGRKLGGWWYSWLSKPGTHRNPKPADPSFPGGSRGGSCSVSCGSARGLGHVAHWQVAASAVPTSANAANRPIRERRSPTAPSHISRSSSIQSAGDRLSTISNSRISSRASGQNDRPSRNDPRGIYRQFGRRSSRSTSPQPSLNTVQSRHSDIVPADVHTHADRGTSPTISLRISTDFLTLLSPQERASPPPTRRSTPSTTSIGSSWDVTVQSPSVESLPNSSLIYARELTDEPMTMETPISLTDRSDTDSQHSYATSFAQSDHFRVMPPDGRIVCLINPDQIPRYTRDITTHVFFFYNHAVFTHHTCLQPS